MQASSVRDINCMPAHMCMAATPVNYVSTYTRIFAMIAKIPV